MERLIEGFKRFRANYFEANRARFERLAGRPQRPRYAIVTCCDSRIDTTRVFDAVPGEVFLIRNIANLVPPYEPDEHHHSTSAAIEYAVRVLKVSQFVIMGHAGCGGIRALLEPPAEPTDFMALWLDMAASARDWAVTNTGAPGEERQRSCELQALKLSLNNLLGFPWLNARIEEGSLQVDALYLDLERGALMLYDRPNDRFAEV